MMKTWRMRATYVCHFVYNYTYRSLDDGDIYIYIYEQDKY